MADLKEVCEALLGKVDTLAMNTNAETELFTVPPGKKAIITKVIVYDVSATMAGCDDVNFGAGAAGAGVVWLDAVSALADCTAALDYYILAQAAGEYTLIDGDDATLANRIFNIDIVDGSDGAATASVAVFGFLFDS